jgi:hypothetical protein
MAGRLLIAAGDTVSGPRQLPSSIRDLIDGAEEIVVMTPALPSRLEWLSSATDRARELADERLGDLLGHLGELGSSARGIVGADDPLLAFDEAIADFRPDHLLIALRSGSRAGWQERGLLEKLVERFDGPITVLPMPASDSADD